MGKAEILKRMSEIKALLEGTETVDLEALETEMRSLEESLNTIEKREVLAAKINSVNIQSRKLDKPGEGTPAGTQETDAVEFREFGEFLQTVKWNPQDKRLSPKLKNAL